MSAHFRYMTRNWSAYLKHTSWNKCTHYHYTQMHILNNLPSIRHIKTFSITLLRIFVALLSDGAVYKGPGVSFLMSRWHRRKDIECLWNKWKNRSIEKINWRGWYWCKDNMLKAYEYQSIIVQNGLKSLWI